jgi:hypothetical protein
MYLVSALRCKLYVFFTVTSGKQSHFKNLTPPKKERRLMGSRQNARKYGKTKKGNNFKSVYKSTALKHPLKGNRHLNVLLHSHY